MEHADVVRGLLVMMLGMVGLLAAIPAPCGHACQACERERVIEADRRLREVHRIWHTRPVDDCPYCTGAK